MKHLETVLSSDEKVVKSYHCSKLITPSCDGFLTVTNKRVIFHGLSAQSSDLGELVMSKVFNANSRIVNEVKLDSVSGISSFYGGKLNRFNIVWAIILTISSLIFFSLSSSSRGFFSLGGVGVFIGLLLLAAAVWLFVHAYRKVFFLKVFSSQAMGTPISIGDGYGAIGSNTAVFSLIAAPTDNTDKMMLELGAMISDLQTLGDLAIERWSNR